MTQMNNTMFVEIKSLSQFSIPFVAMLLAQKLLQIISALMMGFLGVDALGAGVLASSFYLIFIIFGIGVLNAVGILIARAFGANDHDKIKMNIINGFIVSLLISIPAIFIIWSIPSFFSIVVQDNKIVSLAAEFLHTVVWGLPAILFFSVLREFLAAVNFQKVVTKIVAIAIPFNFLLNYSLVNGKWGLPSLSIAGIGYANALTEWFMLICLAIYIAKKDNLNKYFSFFKMKQIEWTIIAEVLRVGLPSGFTLTFEVMMSAVLTVMIGYFGAASLAAHQIAFQCVTTVYMIPLGVSLASGLRISQFIGSQQKYAVSQTIRAGLSIGLLFSLLLVPVFLFLPDMLITLFISKEQEGFNDVRAIAVTYLGIGAVFLCFDALQGIISGCLRGFKDTFMTMIITILSYLIVALGGGYLFAFVFELGGLGLWWGLALGLAVSCVLLSLRLRYQLNKLNHPQFAEHPLHGEYA